MITPYRPAKIVGATGRTNCRLSPRRKVGRTVRSPFSSGDISTIVVSNGMCYYVPMNRFRDDDAQNLFEGQTVRSLPPDIQRRARTRLQRVVAAVALTDLRVPPSHRLEALRRDREGQHSIRINDQWRVCFVWTDLGAMEIEVTDYH